MSHPSSEGALKLIMDSIPNLKWNTEWQIQNYEILHLIIWKLVGIVHEKPKNPVNKCAESMNTR